MGAGRELNRFPIELILDLAHQLFKDVLQGDEPIHAPMLIHHQGQVLFALLEGEKEGFEALGFRREEGGPRQLPQIHRRALFVEGPEQVLEVDHAHHAIKISIHQGQARVGRFPGSSQVGFQALLQIQVGHLDARHHHLPHHAFRELEEVLDEFLAREIQGAFGPAAKEDVL